jgi:hypothetical protein
MLNMLSPLNFKFTLKRAPNLNFFVQKINIPGISLPKVDTSNPLIKIPLSGDHLEYDELDVTFKVDENLQNYLEVHNWVRSLGKPSFEEYANLSKKAIYTGEGLKSDIVVTILTSQKNPNYEFVFKDAFPISVSSISFESTDESVNYIEATARFVYTIFDIVKVT